jgi:hypothetical protein
MQEPQNPRLVYFVQEGAQIWLCVKTDETGLIRWPLTLTKAADLSAELARMVSVGIRNCR